MHIQYSINKYSIAFVSFILWLSIWLVACDTGADSVAVVAEATNTSQSTNTPTLMPSSTPSPSATAMATSTNTATPTPTATSTPTSMPTPTATPSGGGGDILFQVRLQSVDPSAAENPQEVFALNPATNEINRLTTGLNRFVSATFLSPDEQYVLLESRASYPPNLFQPSQLDIINRDGSLQRTITARMGEPSPYWLPDGRYVYTSHENGTVSAFIGSPENEEVERISPLEHNLILLYPTDSLEKIYYAHGTISRESAAGGGPAGSSRRMNVRGEYWAAINEPIDDLSWDRLETTIHFTENEYEGEPASVGINLNFSSTTSDTFIFGGTRQINYEDTDKESFLEDFEVFVPREQLEIFLASPSELLSTFQTVSVNLMQTSIDGTLAWGSTCPEEGGGCDVPTFITVADGEVWTLEEYEAYPLYKNPLSPLGDRMLLENGDEQFVYDWQTEEITAIPMIEGVQFNDWAWSPDGQQILFMHDYSSASITRVDLATLTTDTLMGIDVFFLLDWLP